MAKPKKRHDGILIIGVATVAVVGMVWYRKVHSKPQAPTYPSNPVTELGATSNNAAVYAETYAQTAPVISEGGYTVIPTTQGYSVLPSNGSNAYGNFGSASYTQAYISGPTPGGLNPGGLLAQASHP